MTAEAVTQRSCGRQSFAGSMDVSFPPSRHALSLAFALLCVPAALLGGNRLSLSLAPLPLLLVAAIATVWMARAGRRHPPQPDPRQSERRDLVLAALGGAAWGIAAPFWFSWTSVPAEAALALAYLGMAATAFIALSARRAAYATHTVLGLGPLVMLFLLRDGTFAALGAAALTLFAALSIGFAGCPEGGEAAPPAGEDAKRSALARSAFVANISHELRTPLNALLGMAQLLERADLPKRQADHVKVMLEAGRGLQTLLDDVIALARDDEDALADEDCDPLVIARAVTKLLQARAWEKGLRLTLTAPRDLPRVAADPKRLRQALLKYADNALKFTDHGLVDIRLDLDESQAGRPMVRFGVSDTGTGVAPDVAPLLFRPFSPGDSSYARAVQGAGLGLAVAKRIVEQAGGEVGFESTRGQGALFWFTLPVSGQIAPAGLESIAPEEQAPPPHGLSLLVSVPAPDVAASLAGFLEPFGNRLTMAASAVEATARASHEEYDALITGAEEADLLAAAPGVRAPILAVLLRGDRAPAATDCLLRWPVTADTLFRAIETVCASPCAESGQASLSPAIDAAQFSALEKSLGTKTLIEILQCYVATAEQLSAALLDASREEKWDEAQRMAHDIVGAAGGLGLSAVTEAARRFGQLSREGGDADILLRAAGEVAGEHARAQKALVELYPQLG